MDFIFHIDKKQVNPIRGENKMLDVNPGIDPIKIWMEAFEQAHPDLTEENIADEIEEAEKILEKKLSHNLY